MENEQTEIEELPSRSVTDEDRYYEELLYKDPVETTTRTEETAKFLLGITAGTSGLYLSAYKLAMGKATVSGLVWFAPFFFWAFSIISLVLVIFPQKYETYKDEPASLKRAVLKARDRKYRRLFAGTLFFIFGIFSCIFTFTCK
ncbi:MAG: hypothetical protein GY795_37880 [Desulfobacterales bacterium]|nr:hypothetical protein [Desulfobacterales bacterium]